VAARRVIAEKKAGATAGPEAFRRMEREEHPMKIHFPGAMDAATISGEAESWRARYVLQTPAAAM